MSILQCFGRRQACPMRAASLSVIILVFSCVTRGRIVQRTLSNPFSQFTIWPRWLLILRSSAWNWQDKASIGHSYFHSRSYCATSRHEGNYVLRTAFTASHSSWHVVRSVATASAWTLPKVFLSYLLADHSIEPGACSLIIFIIRFGNISKAICANLGELNKKLCGLFTPNTRRFGI